MSEDVHDRLDRLESLVEDQHDTIETQRDRIATLEGDARERVPGSGTVPDGGKVVGEIGTDDAIGVLGRTTGNGKTEGVRGEAESNTGAGVTGFVNSAGYTPESFDTSATAVRGETDRSDAETGVDSGIGVIGLAAATSGLAYGVGGRCDSPDGIGVLGTNRGGGYGVYSTADMATEGNHVIGGDLSFTDGSTQRTAGPIAKGTIQSDGSIVNAVNVESAIWISASSVYEITLSGVSYNVWRYATVITPINGTMIAEVNSQNDNIRVILADTDGNRVQGPFQFVTYDLPSGQVTPNSASPDADGADETRSDGFAIR